MSAKRLILCLDGTWNKQDDNTNVLHLYNLIATGWGPDEVEQRTYYDEGVGTGVLDGVSGGAFGLGLEENVRQAMDWLIANYDEHDDPKGGKICDEIYIYGFSRGAFTARSLVSFVAKCGIPRRGAPLTVNQFWEGCCLHSRRDEIRENWWEKLAGRPPLPFRSIDELQEDTWRGALPEGDWRKQYKHSEAGFEFPTDLNDTEVLLKKWCRRPPIKCLGIFDTVGSMGLEALAIPGLRSKLAANHNLRLHSIIGHAFHALAIDEQRSSFRHTPLQEFVGGGRTSKNPDKTIKQLWFVGAHSNIGGGYGDNTLCSLALEWMVSQSEKLGLRLKPNADQELQERKQEAATALRSLKDSYADFGGVVWDHVVRAKRFYRPICPEAETAAWPRIQESYTLRDVGSGVHESVETIVCGKEAAAQHYAPPNLLEYATRKGNVAMLQCLKDRCKHVWPAYSWGARFWLVLWSCCAAAGLWCLPGIFAQTWNAGIHWECVVVAFAGLLPLVDWGESGMGHVVALDPTNGRRRAWLDVLFWVRSFGLVMFALGFPFVLWHVAQALWALDLESLHGGTAGTVAVAAVVGAVLPSVRRNFAPPPAIQTKTTRSPLAVVALLLAGGVLLVAIRAAVNAWTGGLPKLPDFPQTAANGAMVEHAGMLLMLELMFFYYLNSFLQWVGEPMARLHLRSIFFLQIRRSAQGVHEQLSEWATSLLRKPLDDDKPDDKSRAVRAANQMRQAVDECLWRDGLGFVWIYTALFVLGLAFIRDHLEWNIFAELPRWSVWVLPLIVAVLDLVENIIHGRCYLRAFCDEKQIRLENGEVRGGKPNDGLALLTFVISMAKLGFFLLVASVVFVALVCGGWELLMNARTGGWRAGIALVLWGFILAGGIIHGLILLKNFVKGRHKKPTKK
ncbi:MAG: DUF2235 domain-containing protein [Prosthecobacter sp.]